MKATIDVPDPLYRRIKARSALAGRTVRDVTIALYERWLNDSSLAGPGPDHDPQRDADRWLAGWDALGAEIALRATDPRTAREILVADRR